MFEEKEVFDITKAQNTQPSKCTSIIGKTIEIKKQSKDTW